jgi:hypothetical protein
MSGKRRLTEDEEPEEPRKRKNIKFTEETRDPGNIYRHSTTRPNPGVNDAGLVHPGTRINSRTGQLFTPVGSMNESGTGTGDFRGLGVINPWGGRKSRRNRNRNRSRSRTKGRSRSRKYRRSMRRRKN